MSNTNANPTIKIEDKKATNVNSGNLLKVTVKFKKDKIPYEIVSQKIEFISNCGNKLSDESYIIGQ